MRALLSVIFAFTFAQDALADATAQAARIERGAYLVAIANCASCHAQEKGGAERKGGAPGKEWALIGADIGYRVGDLGIFYPPNLTPDPETGLGKWTEQDIVTSLHTGFRPDGRQLAPIMPWRAYAHLTQEDAMSIAVYLKSLAPIRHAVPPPATPQSATYPYHDVVTPKTMP